ncbi:hypothetical protein PoB_004169900 [Plakobranchus ocellatus]|uniref:Uncharacterized protein n=1 Tax=Plakobranchus ocellatus TaxID=259542 RepID=A0AAV4BA03_9GAST|nr:hypothetical protein PoB_004169900 [Plakobranchus ocellatus]
MPAADITTSNMKTRGSRSNRDIRAGSTIPMLTKLHCLSSRGPHATANMHLLHLLLHQAGGANGGLSSGCEMALQETFKDHGKAWSLYSPNAQPA